MSEVTIKIKNCNCIKSADIKLEEGTLNIKYGSNGTGKSTISKAVFLKTHGSEEELRTLLPYGADKGQKCEVDGISFNKVMVFDESYVNSYLFKEKSFLENSFRVFLRSEECDRLANEITNLLAELQGIFQENEAIQNVKSFLPKYAEAVKYSDGEISKKGGVGEFLKGNGAGFDKYDELKVYKPFYDRDLVSVSKWAKWRNDGIKQMNGETCPFCADELKEEIEKQNKVISKVFKNSALSTANAVLEYLREAVEKNYIKADALSALQEYISSTGKEDSLESELQNLAVETEYLYKKIEKICQFRPMNVTHSKNNNLESKKAELPSNKADYMRMSVDEKVSCYQFDVKGTDSAFEMVKAYFETVGLSTDFNSVYDETKLLMDYYEEQNAEEYIRERTEQIIEKMDLIGIDTGKITEYSADVLSEVFGFEDMEYFAGIKMFNKVLDKLDVDMDLQKRYEVFDRIYEERLCEKEVEQKRNSR